MTLFRLVCLLGYDVKQLCKIGGMNKLSYITLLREMGLPVHAMISSQLCQGPALQTWISFNPGMDK